jgi:hypothetical protein
MSSETLPEFLARTLERCKAGGVVMVRRNPLTQLGIQERPGWPITDAALRGPNSYEELAILTDKQRRELVQYAQVLPEKEKQFVEDVTCQIIQYRHEQNCDAQERPAAVAAAMRK